MPHNAVQKRQQLFHSELLQSESCRDLQRRKTIQYIQYIQYHPIPSNTIQYYPIITLHRNSPQFTIAHGIYARRLLKVVAVQVPLSW